MNLSQLFTGLICGRIAAFLLLSLVVSGGTGSAQSKPAAKAAPARPAAAATPAKTGGGSGSSAVPHTAGASTGVNRGATTSNTTGSRGVTTTTNPHTNTGTPMNTGPHANTGNSNRPATTTTRPVERGRPSGASANRDTHIPAHNMDIHRNLTGERRIVVNRGDHSRIVVDHRGRGFVERPYRYGGHEFARRSYYYHGRVYPRYYGGYYYRGAYLQYYAPTYYYRPAFYGWAYAPWAAPVPYYWGWNAAPWYGYYGPAYFAPYPVYPSASFWLTDYLLSASLQAAYEARAAQAQEIAVQQALPQGGYGLTPDVKDLISAEVQRQIALENQEAQNAQTGATDPASSSVQRMLNDRVQHVFVVGNDLDVTNSAGMACAVSQGDALQLAGPPPADATAATLIVLSSKGGVECRRSESVSVQISDLQEMQNHMREQVDEGLAELRSKQGSGNVPALPPSATGEPVKATFVSAAPPPEANVGGEISQQQQLADASEGGPSVGPAPAPPAQGPARIELGQSIDEVTGTKGAPDSIADLGARKIYVYRDMKITFIDGKVSSAQ